MANVQAQTGSTAPLAGSGLLRPLAENWWLLLLRGIAALAFGTLTFVWPGITLLTLTLLWGAYALADGVLALWAAASGNTSDVAPRWWLAVAGIVSVAAGALTFLWPGMTALVLLFFIASWAIVIGVMQIWGAIRLRKEIEGEWLLVVSGLLSIGFGVILFVWPGAGALAVVWTIGWYAILAGCLSIALAFRLKQYKVA